MTSIKICCIASEAEAAMALAYGADALGFVSEMPSGPGVIDDETIAKLIGQLPENTNAFLLTSRTAPDDVVAHVQQCKPATVQLVDAVPLETYEALHRDCAGTKIVQVIHVEGKDAVQQAEQVAPHVDAVLLDSGSPGSDVKELGGTGRVHDWSVSYTIVAAVGVPVYLAGGLLPNNVGAAIKAVRPFGVDLCSGVRTNGALDMRKLKGFMAAVRAA